MNIQRFSPYSYGRDIKVSPHDPKVFYACVSVASHGNTGAIFRSDDIGKTWSRFDHSTEPMGTMMCVSPHAGDVQALKTLAYRVWPVRRGSPITFYLPHGDNAGTATTIVAVFRQVANGLLSPEEGAAVVALIEARPRALET